MTDESAMIAMALITNGGNARSLAMKAIYAAKAGNFDEAEKNMEECNQFLVSAHKSQTELLTAEAGGQAMDVSILLIHAQDHLMNAITVRDLAEEIIDVYKHMEER